MALIEVQYLIDGVIYNIVETADVHEKLQNDPIFASNYVSDNSTQLEFQPQTATGNENDDNFTWTQDTIQLLITEYEKRKDKFRNPSIKKKSLWLQIKNEFLKHDHIITTEALDKKFRNLKKTYVKIHDNNKKTSTGKGTVAWQYYDSFCNIFDKDKTISIDHTLSSMNVMTENMKTVNPEVLDLSIDLFDRSNESILNDVSTDQDNAVSVSCSNTSNNKATKCKKKLIKRNYDVFRKDVVEINKEKVQESKKLREAVDNMINVQKERNKIFADLSEYLKNKSQ